MGHCTSLRTSDNFTGINLQVCMNVLSNRSISFHQSILEHQLKIRNIASKLKTIPTLGESKKK
jgi:hypothetical protein